MATALPGLNLIRSKPSTGRTVGVSYLFALITVIPIDEIAKFARELPTVVAFFVPIEIFDAVLEVAITFVESTGGVDMPAILY